MGDSAAATEWSLPSLSEVKEAAKLISCFMPATPQFRWPLSFAILTGGNVDTEVYARVLSAETGDLLLSESKGGLG